MSPKVILAGLSMSPPHRTAFNSACRIPICCLLMTAWKPTPRAPAKTKEELREMQAQAVRNTQPETEPKPLPKPKKGRR